jgi:2-polyprenyl-6-methoxyphenol hydroxylase-like FAD-dependent oxidoreductase
MHVLISGAGIAGPALALCLNRLGMKTTVVEKATTLRAGGQAVDFRGPVHRAVLERMHLWDAIHERRTLPQGLELLNTDGSPCATMPSVMMCGDVEILRGDLSQLLYERTRDHSEYRFGERVAELNDRGDHVEVEFERAPAERFDIVIGADGLHSGVRKRIFGNETTALAHHGYRIATFSLENSFGLRENAQVYSQPGRAVCLTATARNSARALLIHTGGRFEYEGRDLQAQLPVLRKRFENMGWHAPRVMAAMAHTSDFYADAIATVHLRSYSSGRVALLGDAAYGGTLGGQGTSLAIVGAYVLAGELARDQDPHVAFQRYEHRMRSYASGCQKGAARAGSFFAPRSALGLRARDAMYALLTSRPLARVFEKLVTQAASDFELPEYSPSLA